MGEPDTPDFAPWTENFLAVRRYWEGAGDICQSDLSRLLQNLLIRVIPELEKGLT
jgi:hypothetical protein